MVQAQLEPPVAQQHESTVGEQPHRVAGLKTVVLVVGYPIKNTQPLTEMNERVNPRRWNRAHDPPAWLQERETRRGQLMLGRRWDVLQHREQGDGVVSVALRQRGRRIPLYEPERSVVPRHRGSVDADPRCYPAPEGTEHGAVAAPNVEDTRARGDVRRGLMYAPGLQDRIALFDLNSSHCSRSASGIRLHARSKTLRVDPTDRP
jgi:hypothetical protein